jgi:ketosteroid isomerase-like protein
MRLSKLGGILRHVMSREDVDFIRTVYEAFNRAAQSGDVAPWIEAFFDQEVEWRLAEDQPDAGPFRGHEGVKRLFDGWLEAWDDWALEPEEFIEAGDAWVVQVRIHGRGKESGMKIEVPYAHVVKLRGGRIVEVHDYSTKKEALQAVGLPESPLSR